MAAPKQGDTYTFSAAEPIGVDANALFPGQQITVREVVDAGEVGAHDSSEDAVVVEWDAPALVRTEKGVEQGTAPRAMSIGLEQFAESFTKG